MKWNLKQKQNYKKNKLTNLKQIQSNKIRGQVLNPPREPKRRYDKQGKKKDENKKQPKKKN